MSRSLEYLRSQGYYCDIAEHFDFYSKRRKDLFGFADILALLPGTILAIQTTSGSNFSARKHKIETSEGAKRWLEAGGNIEIHGWKKKGGKGKRKLWSLKTINLPIPKAPVF